MKKILVMLPLLWLFVQPTMAARYRYLGDINNDGKVDMTDLNLLVDIVSGKTEMPSDIRFCDISKDKKVDVEDIVQLIAMLKGDKPLEQIDTTIFIPVDDERGGFD